MYAPTPPHARCSRAFWRCVPIVWLRVQLKLCWLGKGSGGEVFLALHLPTQRLFVLKEIDCILIVRAADAVRTLTAAIQLQKLDGNRCVDAASRDSLHVWDFVEDHDNPANKFRFHKNISAMVYIDSEGSKLLIGYDWLSGGSMDKALDYLHSYGKPKTPLHGSGRSGMMAMMNLTPSFAVSLSHRLKFIQFFFSEVAEGICYLHNEFQTVHRDLKPSNVAFCSFLGTAVLVDFGAARVLSGDDNTTLSSKERGDYQFRAPELFDVKSEQTESSAKPADVWAFGLILYRAAVGIPPTKAWLPEGEIAAYNFLHDPKNIPRLDRSKYPADLCDLVEGCLRVNISPFDGKDKRRWTAKEVAESPFWFTPQDIPHTADEWKPVVQPPSNIIKDLLSTKQSTCLPAADAKDGGTAMIIADGNSNNGLTMDYLAMLEDQLLNWYGHMTVSSEEEKAFNAVISSLFHTIDAYAGKISRTNCIQPFTLIRKRPIDEKRPFIGSIGAPSPELLNAVTELIADYLGVCLSSLVRTFADVCSVCARKDVWMYKYDVSCLNDTINDSFHPNRFLHNNMFARYPFPPPPSLYPTISGPPPPAEPLHPSLALHPPLPLEEAPTPRIVTHDLVYGSGSGRALTNDWLDTSRQPVYRSLPGSTAVTQPHASVYSSGSLAPSRVNSGNSAVEMVPNDQPSAARSGDQVPSSTATAMLHATQRRGSQPAIDPTASAQPLRPYNSTGTFPSTGGLTNQLITPMVPVPIEPPPARSAVPTPKRKKEEKDQQSANLAEGQPTKPPTLSSTSNNAYASAATASAMTMGRMMGGVMSTSPPPIASAESGSPTSPPPPPPKRLHSESPPTLTAANYPTAHATAEAARLGGSAYSSASSAVYGSGSVTSTSATDVSAAKQILGFSPTDTEDTRLAFQHLVINSPPQPSSKLTATTSIAGNNTAAGGTGVKLPSLTPLKSDPRTPSPPGGLRSPTSPPSPRARREETPGITDFIRQSDGRRRCPSLFANALRCRWFGRTFDPHIGKRSMEIAVNAMKVVGGGGSVASTPSASSSVASTPYSSGGTGSTAATPSNLKPLKDHPLDAVFASLLCGKKCYLPPNKQPPPLSSTTAAATGGNEGKESLLSPHIPRIALDVMVRRIDANNSLFALSTAKSTNAGSTIVGVGTASSATTAVTSDAMMISTRDELPADDIASDPFHPGTHGGTAGGGTSTVSASTASTSQPTAPTLPANPNGNPLLRSDVQLAGKAVEADTNARTFTFPFQFAKPPPQSDRDLAERVYWYLAQLFVLFHLGKQFGDRIPVVPTVPFAARFTDPTIQLQYYWAARQAGVSEDLLDRYTELIPSSATTVAAVASSSTVTYQPLSNAGLIPPSFPRVRDHFPFASALRPAIDPTASSSTAAAAPTLSGPSDVPAVASLKAAADSPLATDSNHFEEDDEDDGGTAGAVMAGPTSSASTTNMQSSYVSAAATPAATSSATAPATTTAATGSSMDESTDTLPPPSSLSRTTSIDSPDTEDYPSPPSTMEDL